MGAAGLYFLWNIGTHDSSSVCIFFCIQPVRRRNRVQCEGDGRPYDAPYSSKSHHFEID